MSLIFSKIFICHSLCASSYVCVCNREVRKYASVFKNKIKQSREYRKLIFLSQNTRRYFFFNRLWHSASSIIKTQIFGYTVRARKISSRDFSNIPGNFSRSSAGPRCGYRPRCIIHDHKEKRWTNRYAERSSGCCNNSSSSSVNVSHINRCLHLTTIKKAMNF